MAKARTRELLASGFRRFSWRGKSTHSACATRMALARTPPLAAFFIVVLFPSLMAQLAVALTRHPSMCQRRTRTPPSATRGTSLRRYHQSRFASQHNLQVPLAWVNVPGNSNNRLSPQLRTAFRSPTATAWRVWKTPFPVHLPRPFPVITQPLRLEQPK